MTTSAIRTVGLGRTYRLPAKERRRRREASTTPAEFVALDNVHLEVQTGELFGLLGSNGAGKTTLIKILTTLLAPTTGTAQVDGLDVIQEAEKLRPRINMVSGGETSGYGVLTVKENLWLFSQLYGVPSREASRRIDGLLAAVELTDKANTRISYLSTGLRQRMNFCRGLVTNPRILFLDEPTLGLDVSAARTIRQLIKDWMQELPGRTVILTTHYMAEADELCDRVAIIHRGKVMACDAPSALKRRVQRYTIFEMVLSHAKGGNGYHELGRLPGVRQFSFAERPTDVAVKVALEEEGAVGSVVQEVLSGGSRILALKKVEPTLEDVFVEMVGQGLGPREVDR